ncbi:MAG TPA: hypothetical protein PKE62_11005 [Anaerolineales bacterium]|nr:hypothetical protein [Anaerolineales bacterium]
MQKHPNLPPIPEPRNDWLAQLARLNDRFGRFARDAFGIFLFAASLMTFLALRNFTEGSALSPWVDFLSLGLAGERISWRLGWDISDSSPFAAVDLPSGGGGFPRFCSLLF